MSVKKLDKIIHEPARLNLIAFLLNKKLRTVLELKSETGLSWGNISIHLNKLGKAGYIEMLKTYKNNKPLTRVKITPQGKKAYDKYKKTIKLLLK